MQVSAQQIAYSNSSKQDASPDSIVQAAKYPQPRPKRPSLQLLADPYMPPNHAWAMQTVTALEQQQLSEVDVPRLADELHRLMSHLDVQYCRRRLYNTLVCMRTVSLLALALAAVQKGWDDRSHFCDEYLEEMQGVCTLSFLATFKMRISMSTSCPPWLSCLHSCM